MATNKAELQTMVANYMAGTYETVQTASVPAPEDVPLGNKAKVLTATALFIDIRQSSDITNTFRRQTAAKMLKSYFDGAVRIIRHNGGDVRSFNGDGMLALFVGKSQRNDAVRAAMQVKWFVRHVLAPKFNDFFDRDAARGQRLDFAIGCGIDYGDIYAVKVGIRGTNDVAWVGRCTNTAAKLANVLRTPRNVGVTRAVYKALNKDRKYSKGKLMWSDEKFARFGGVQRAYRTTTYRRSMG
jgi:class 3 adenylate cyclase